MTKPTCGTCRWFFDLGSRGYGVCLRHPPVVDPSIHAYTDGDRRQGVHPTTDPDLYCGEHQPITPETTP
jgi:hypothetical protein